MMPDEIDYEEITPDDQTALPDAEVIQKLATLNSIEYDRQREAQAKTLGVRASTLDKEVKAIKGAEKEAGRLPFANIEPYPYPIEPAQLLDDVSGAIRQFIVLDEYQAHAAALWCALTYFIEVVEVAPLAIINAPEKACGKTQLLNVMGRMSYKPLPASNASASALFRAVELWKPTILIDEADTFFRDNTELHGMVNAGYLKGGYVLRSESVGDSFEPRMFSVYSAKALAGIKLEKHLPDATMSRGIVFSLRRKLQGESVSRLRHADPNLFERIASKLARFAEDYSERVRQVRTVLPDELSDREQDNWDGMLAIATCAGSEWLAKATAAALKISASSSEQADSAGNELLSDIQNVFESKRIDKISTADLIAALCDDEEAPWSTYNRGKPIVARQLKKQLEPYRIESKKIRIDFREVRGFEVSQFADAFMRYLTTPILSVYPSQVATNPEAARPIGGTDNETGDRYSIYPSQLQPSNGAIYDSKTDKKAFLGVGVNAPIEEPEYF
jgi:putative DNA primase/helicase